MERNGSWINWILFGNFVYQFTRWTSGQISFGQLLYRGIIKPLLFIAMTLLLCAVVFVSCTGINVKDQVTGHAQAVSESSTRVSIAEQAQAMLDLQKAYTDRETDNDKILVLTDSVLPWFRKFDECGEKKDYKCQVDMLNTRTALINKMMAESTTVRK